MAVAIPPMSNPIRAHRSGICSFDQMVKEAVLGSAFQLNFEFRVDYIINLLAVLQIERTIPPSSSEFAKSQFLGTQAVIFHKIDKVASDVVGNDLLAKDRLIIVLYQVPNAHCRVMLFSVLERYLPEFFVHVCIEISNEEVRPELIENVHVAVTAACSDLFTLLQGISSKYIV